MTYEPMLAHPVDVDKLPKYEDYWWEPKLDGVRCIVQKFNDHVTLTSRGNKDFTAKLPHLVGMFERIPGSFVLDGELGYYSDDGQMPIIDFNKTMRVIGSGVEEALRKQASNRHPSNRQNQQSHDIGFFAFDMLYWDDPLIAFTNESRRTELSAWRNRHMALLHPPTFDLTDWFQPGVHSPDELMDLYNKYVDRGGEGMMIKNPQGLYYPGKRKANTWYKLKRNETLDVKITGSIPGQGKFASLVGAITFVEPESGRTGKCSGMTDQQRADFTEYYSNGYQVKTGALDEKYLGKWMEIRHFGLVGSEGESYRHPQFVRLRPDKDA